MVNTTCNIQINNSFRTLFFSIIYQRYRDEWVTFKLVSIWAFSLTLSWIATTTNSYPLFFILIWVPAEWWRVTTNINSKYKNFMLNSQSQFTDTLLFLKYGIKVEGSNFVIILATPASWSRGCDSFPNPGMHVLYRVYHTYPFSLFSYETTR